mmetsp:Transcript_53934/g.159843  ORF Transcript_53934/g.159843 Transcript_53934/m.159843 type:complete len:808 (-) Transcript_53934:119-2542(-)
MKAVATLPIDVQEQLKLGEAARAALAESEGRWRRERGAAAQERMRLRADIAALTQRRSKPLVHSPPGRAEGEGHAAKRARLDAGPPSLGGADGNALSRTELYTMYHSTEEALRSERERAADAETQLARLLTELDVQLPIYMERSERLKGALERNSTLSERLASAHTEADRLTGEVGRLELEARVLRGLSDEMGAQSSLPNGVAELKEELLRELCSLRLPDNPLDELIHQLGGTERVAELTGRKQKLVYEHGRPKPVQRAKELEVSIAQVNMSEKNAFMSGAKMIAIISEAASSGISLQADRRVANRARRVHITLELPWSADEALQQLGRSHRSNQTSAPEYKLLMTSLGGERRFAAELAKRLQALGALTKGDRRAADASQLSEFDYQTRYGKRALQELIDSIRSRQPGDGRTKALFEAVLGAEKAKEALDTGDLGAWEEHCERVEHGLMVVGIDLANTEEAREKMPSVKTLLNRLLGMEVAEQNRAFTHFAAIFDDLVARDKSEGKFDDGVVDLKANQITLQRTVPFYTDQTTKARSSLYTLSLDRGVSWAAAKAELDAANAREEAEGNRGHINGFYESKAFSGMMGRKHQHLVIRKQYQYGVAHQNRFYEMYRVIRPNMGLVEIQQRGDVEERYIKHNTSSGGPLSVAARARAEREWSAIFEQTGRGCLHKQPCSKLGCVWGGRSDTEALMVGCILPLWSAIERLVLGFGKGFLRVTRVRLSDGQRVVGVKVPSDRLGGWRQLMTQCGVTIDRDAYQMIDLVEKDAERQGKASANHAGADDGTDGTGAAGSAAGAGAGGRKRKAGD